MLVLSFLFVYVENFDISMKLIKSSIYFFRGTVLNLMNCMT